MFKKLFLSLLLLSALTSDGIVALPTAYQYYLQVNAGLDLSVFGVPSETLPVLAEKQSGSKVSLRTVPYERFNLNINNLEQFKSKVPPGIIDLNPDNTTPYPSTIHVSYCLYPFTQGNITQKGDLSPPIDSFC